MNMCVVTTRARATRDGCARDVETAHARAKRDASSVDASDRREKAGRKKEFFFVVARGSDARAEDVARAWTTRRRGAGPRATRIRIARGRGGRGRGR